MSTRLWRLAAIAGVAIVAVTVAVLASSASSEPEPVTVEREAPGLLDGIPERKGVLGAADAPVTVTEFLDPQCPACAAAAREVLPTLINNHVRTGEVKLDAAVLHFLGPDSVKAATYAAGARAQDKLWPFLETFFASQGTENAGYVTDDFLADVAAAAGVDHERALAHDGSADLNAANAAANRLGVTGTPTFVIERAGGKQQVVDAAGLLQAL